MADSGIPNDMPGIVVQSRKEKRQEERVKRQDRKATRWVIDSAPGSETRETAESGWVNLFEDIYKFVTEEPPNSVKADERGITIGEFVIDNPTLAAVMKSKRDELQELIGSPPDFPQVSVTYFQNWADTTGSGLLLHAKPTTVAHVALLVEKARELDLKVQYAQARVQVILCMHSISIYMSERACIFIDKHELYS